MGPHGYALTDRDVMLAHWLEMVPGHLEMLARTGLWTAKADALHARAAAYGMGRN